VNSNKSANLVTDPNDREFNEAWPRGRFNHYWFDMNRDWLPVQLPESQARIKPLESGCQMSCVIFMKWEQILHFPTRRTHSNQSAYSELNQVLTVKLQDTTPKH
jgi:hypothetical protein